MKKIFVLTILTLCLFEISFTQTYRTREEWENYFKANITSLDPIEGLWNATITPTVTSVSSGRQNGGDQTLTNLYAVVKGDVGFDAICIECSLPWVTTFEKSANPKLYFYKENIPGARLGVTVNVVLSDIGVLDFSYYYPDSFKKKMLPNASTASIYDIRMNVKCLWIKAFPMQTDINKSIPSSGTGFAISKDGIIVTNYHVVENGKTIVVKGINGDFNRSLKAVTLVSDKINDIALIKIQDPSFNDIKSIPYIIKRELSGVGDEVFVLGYPLRATMGDEIKLPNGIISSKTGFQGDITTYQISAPVQPGNSGGPLFNKSGDLIGIVNAKHTGAENVSYAIKANYIYGLIELLDNPPTLPKENTMKQMSLADQVKVVKDFIYIIEVN